MKLKKEKISERALKSMRRIEIVREGDYDSGVARINVYEAGRQNPVESYRTRTEQDLSRTLRAFRAKFRVPIQNVKDMFHGL